MPGSIASLLSHSIYFALAASILFQLSGCTLSHNAILHIRTGQIFHGWQYGQALLSYTQTVTSSRSLELEACRGQPTSPHPALTTLPCHPSP